ncbi:MAG: Uma2 family endonuclease [Thermomicrobiales bacterium]|nr:Uma2 family endonuclease [Thermomicrobiales bacterium]
MIGAADLVAAPDLVCEIFSLSTRRRDLVTKRALYTRIGVRENWLVDPDARSVTGLALEAGGYVELPPDATRAVSSRVLPDLRFTLSDIFEDADIAPGDGVRADAATGP